LKVGQILGGTPFRMEWAEIIGVVFASMFLVLPMMLLHEGDIAAGGIGIGGEELPAPQAGLMALLSQGIVGGDMRWPLVVFGIALCLFLILIQAPSPMLIAVGMYLPLQTTFAIFVGGFFRWLSDRQMAKLPAERRTLGESAGTLIASGLIAGEALMGVGLSGFAVAELQLPILVSAPSGIPGFLVFVVLGWFLIRIPLRHARG
ncbi:MAG: OPT/YSL family transporter, partial [Acidobacteriota bacterium]|nr:OPT/YSL family transporter [Acidobacteriota bacterium]